jgi:single-strand DNA-binding protein
MAGNINKVILIGSLGCDSKISGTQAGGSLVCFTLTTWESWRDRTTGEPRERTVWHHIVIFNERLVEIAKKYLRKGSKVYVEGQLRTRQWEEWEDHEIRRRGTTEVVLSEYRGELVMLDRGETPSL